MNCHSKILIPCVVLFLSLFQGGCSVEAEPMRKGFKPLSPPAEVDNAGAGDSTQVTKPAPATPPKENTAVVPKPDTSEGVDFEALLANAKLLIEPQAVIARPKEFVRFSAALGGTTLNLPIKFMVIKPPEKVDADLGSFVSNGVYLAPEQLLSRSEEVVVVAYLRDYPDIKTSARVKLMLPGDFGIADDPKIKWGLTADLYDLSATKPDKLPDFASMKSISRMTVPNFDVAPTNFEEGFPGAPELTEWFGLRAQGFIVIPQDGWYEFHLESDDGSKLTIDNRLIIDNDGLHAPVTKSAKVEYKAGTYPFRLDYFQGPRMRIALRLKWTTPRNSAIHTVPTDVFRKVKE